jgi:hypothetical protein
MYRIPALGIFQNNVPCDAGAVPDDQVSRRRVLLLLTTTASLVGAAGCSSPSAANPDPIDRSTVDPDAAIQETAADAERALLAAYAATVARHPELSGIVAAPSTHHAEHLAALTDGTMTPAATATASGGSPTTPRSAALSPAVSDDPRAAVAALAAAERAAAAHRLKNLDAASPALARLLASVGAAEAAHAALLGS